jgi:hypothetical protein
MTVTRSHYNTVVPKNICFPLMSQQGSLLNKVTICLCMYVLTRAHHHDNNSVVNFLLQHGVRLQHIVSLPIYVALTLWLSAVLPSCLLYYSQIKALYMYIMQMSLVFLCYYMSVYTCMIYRPEMTAPLTMVIAVHILDKCMTNTGERVLYGGARLAVMFKTTSMMLILFSWMYLPIHTSSSFDFIICLFAPELLGIGIAFCYYIMEGFVHVAYSKYEHE